MDNLVKITLKQTYYTSFAIYVCENSYFRIFELGLFDDLEVKMTLKKTLNH